MDEQIIIFMGGFRGGNRRLEQPFTLENLT